MHLAGQTELVQVLVVIPRLNEQETLGNWHRASRTRFAGVGFGKSSGDHTFSARSIIACDCRGYDRYRFYRVPARRITLRFLSESSLPIVAKALNFFQMQVANYKSITDMEKLANTTSNNLARRLLST